MQRDLKMRKQIIQIMKRVAFPLLLLLALLLAGDRAPLPLRIVSLGFAAGGSCPSGANYTNPASPQGALVTLASLGITNCYYISAAGADTNNGTSESTPWLHAPQMPNCASNCATAQNVSNGIPPGTGLIFRGGDTWHFGNSSATPYTGGTLEINASPYPNGTSTNPIYYGFDPAWYSGGSWARPIFNADNSVCNGSTLGTLPDGATCSGSTDSYGQQIYYVSNCAYRISGGSNNMLDLGNRAYFIIDNLELTGLCNNTTGTPYEPQGNDTYVRYGGAAGPLTFQNLYIHGASHPKFGAVNGANCTGVVCINIYAFQGGVNSGSVGETIANAVVDFSDSDPAGEQLCASGMYIFEYSVVRYTTNCFPGGAIGPHLWHDILYEYFFENGHSNLFEGIPDSPATANAFYNMVFRHIEAVGNAGAAFLWFCPPRGTTDYIFNNVAYDVGAVEYLNQGGTAGNNAGGTYTYFNNTWQTNSGQVIVRCSNYSNGPVNNTSEHYIDNQQPTGTGCSTQTNTTILWQSNTSGGSASTYSNANTSPLFDQYTSSGTYAYSPVAGTNSTVGAGTNEISGYCSALASAGLTAAASACASDTTYACTYNTTDHTVSCPARTVVARPASGAWDVGAYQSSTPSSPGAATGLKAAPH